MKALPVLSLFFVFLTLTACGGPENAPSIGEAYVGPVNLTLREELTVKSPTVATLRHGEKVEIVDRRRRFFKVRSSRGAIGWTDGRQLLTREEMSELNEQTELAMRLPPHGRAFVYEPLNVHTKPNRQAPSFYRLEQKETAEVLTYRLEPRVPFESPILNGDDDEPKPKRRVKKKTEPKIPPVPRAKPPGLPANYAEISQQPPQDPEYIIARQEREEARKQSVPIEEWSLVRIGDGRAGWVLARMMAMGIPDEVAQYAEGHRITSYFSLGEVRDGDQVKHNWLWTTMGGSNQPYQFDGFRVFIWSLARHRYETSYIERNLIGYHPVTMGEAPYGEGRSRATVPTFAIITQDKEGNVARRTFAFVGQHVRLLSKEPWQVPPPFNPNRVEVTSRKSVPKGQEPSLLTKLTEHVQDLRERWFGR